MFHFLCSAIYSTIVQKSSCNKSSAIRLLLENSFFTSPLRRIINLPALFHKVFPRFSAYTSFTIFLEIKHGLAERICHLTKDGGSNRDHNLVSPATIIRLNLQTYLFPFLLSRISGRCFVPSKENLRY